MSQLIVAVTDDTLEETVLKASGPVLVDFWADWCHPCKALAPVLDAIADEYAGELLVCKVNADQNPAATARFGVRGLPSLLLFSDCVEKGRLLGNVTKTRIAGLLDDCLGDE